jgi:hypothetical protein
VHAPAEVTPRDTVGLWASPFKVSAFLRCLHGVN